MAPTRPAARHSAIDSKTILWTGSTKWSGRTIEARSAGSHPKPVHPNAVRVMAERGVDIGAKSEIVDIIRGMADKGMAVLVISSELEELMAISDRILVLHGGRITQRMNRRDVATEEELHHAIQGHSHSAPNLGAA